MKNPKPEGSYNPYKITDMHILDFLLKNSSETHMVSSMEVCSYFMNRIAYFETEKAKKPNSTLDWNDLSVNIDYDTDQPLYSQPTNTVYSSVRRFFKDNLDKPLIYGITIRCGKTGKVKGNEKVYYAQSPLNEASVSILRDAIEVFPYAENTRTTEIINDLNKLTPVYNRRDFDSDRVSAMKFPDTSYYKNLEEIYKAFRTIKTIPGKSGIEVITAKEKKTKIDEYEKNHIKGVNRISFVYCEYNEKKQLVVKKLKNGEEVREVNPVKILWANGYYYLVAAMPDFQNEGNYIFVNYRIDRMTNVKCLDKPSEYNPRPDAESYPEKHPEKYPMLYAKKNPVMYNDNRTHIKTVELLCSRSLINNVLDTFGFQEVMINKDTDPQKVRVNIRKSSYTGIKMWALEYHYGCEVLSPPELRQEMKEAAEHLMDMYK